MKTTLNNLIEQRNSFKQLKETLAKDLVTYKNKLNGLINKVASSQESALPNLVNIIKKSENEIDTIFLD